MKCIAFVILYVGLISNAYAKGLWQRIAVGANTSEAKAIAIDTRNDKILYSGFQEGLYKTSDGGKTWELLAAGLLSKVNFLYLDPRDSNILYAATENGLFRSNDAGENWQKIFVGKDVQEKNIASIALCEEAPKSIFIATGNGIFFSTVNRIQWQKVGGALLDARISSIAVNPAHCDELFVASSKGLFKTGNRLASYEKLHSGFSVESEDSVTGLDSSEEEISPQENFFSHLTIEEKEAARLYVGTSEGVFFSLDAGKSWKKTILSGLFDERVRYIALGADAPANSVKRIFLATQNGVFACNQDSCKQLYGGQEFQQCNQLAQDAHNNLYLAADRGLFRISLENETAQEIKVVEIIKTKADTHEPGIQEIQQQAIKYAEVYPEKIANWRKQARIKALLPDLTLDYDKTVTTALGATYDRVQVGPRDWGLNLKWDLGDLIFSAEQTSIDVRSRLMVQLRDDIINEVTRLYFERKRLQQELSEAGALNGKAKAEKELRLEELTALIDGLTGGCLSQGLH